MKLQLALDDLPLDEAVRLAQRLEPWIDIVEAGTPLLLEHGLAAVRALKAALPGLPVLADAKIMDAGALEARAAFAAGADLVTVLGVTDRRTIRACLDTADAAGRAVVVDLIAVPDLAACVRELEDLGVRHLAVHTGVDQQAAGRTPLDDLRVVKAHARHARVYVAGGIDTATLPAYARLGADVAVIGGGLCRAADPVAAAQAMRAAAGERESVR
jgi:3-hexulose-6-phosphate synthase